MTFQQAHRFTSLQVSNRDYLKNVAQSYSDVRGKHINELQLLTTKGRVWSLTVNEPELIANGGGAQVALKNITSRFDLKVDDDEQLHVDKTFNGKFISGLVCKNGNLHMFSDIPEKMTAMFPARSCIDTTIGNDQDTKRPSTTVNVGARIVDVSISNTHVLILDIYGRLWSIGMNRAGQLGLGHLIDQSNPKLVPLPSEVVRTISICASSSASVILCEHKDGSVRAYFSGKLSSGNLVGYSICGDSDDEDNDSYHHSRSKVIDRFKEIKINLARHTDIVTMTTNQIVFLSRHEVNKKSAFQQLPTDFHNLGITPCRICSNMEPTWYDTFGNEFNDYVSDKSVDWVNERISRCTCAVGNQIYRSLLIERLTIARQYQRATNDDEDFDNWIERLDPSRSNEVDELIESLALAHSINNQLPPFSALN